MNSYLKYLSAEEIKEKKRGFPFELEIPVNRDGVLSMEIIEMDFKENDPIFYFCIKDSENDSGFSSLELINDLLVDISRTLEVEKRELSGRPKSVSLPSYLLRLPYSLDRLPSVGNSTTLTTATPDPEKIDKKQPDSFLKVMRLEGGWMICGGGRNHVYREALFATLDNAKSSGFLSK